MPRPKYRAADQPKRAEDCYQDLANAIVKMAFEDLVCAYIRQEIWNNPNRNSVTAALYKFQHDHVCRNRHVIRGSEQDEAETERERKVNDGRVFSLERFFCSQQYQLFTTIDHKFFLRKAKESALKTLGGDT